MHRTHMYVHKIFKTNDTSHSSWKGGEGKGWKGSRRDGGFRGEKRDLRKGDAKIISDFLYDSELSLPQDSRDIK